MQIINFLTKIGPIWAHMGPNPGPIKRRWGDLVCSSWSHSTFAWARKRTRASVLHKRASLIVAVGGFLGSLCVHNKYDDSSG